MLIFGFVLAISIKPAVADERLTAHNKDIVRNFYTAVLVGRPQVPTGMIAEHWAAD
jgi:hypothetical protein